MNTAVVGRDHWIAANLREYGYRYDELRFPEAPAALRLQQQRDRLLAEVAGSAQFGCRGTKVDCRDLAPGCRHCVAGTWSCLFVSGRCNAHCFYCPTSQDETGVPTTNTLAFPEPAEYLAYLEQFGFTGASLSGGEPLLTPATTLEFVRAIKGHFGPRLHLWLYTNGTLLTRSLLQELRSAGLDEIRVDVGATRYRLKKVALAAEFIPWVTVEIPAVPEDLEQLKNLLPQFVAAGVGHLNLHQMRLTPHNYRHLVKRGYTFLHGEKVTVLDSELAALELLRHAQASNCGMPVNYCSFVYKHRYQRAAARRRAGHPWQSELEPLTAAGYLRRVNLRGDARRLQGIAGRLATAGLPPGTWHLEDAADCLTLGSEALALLGDIRLPLEVEYQEAVIGARPCGPFPFRTVPLSARRAVVLEKRPVAAPVILDQNQVPALLRWLRGEEQNLPDCLAQLAPWEEISRGLQEYY